MICRVEKRGACYAGWLPSIILVWAVRDVMPAWDAGPAHAPLGSALRQDPSLAQSGQGRAGEEQRNLVYMLETIKRVQNYAGGYLEVFLVNQMAQDAALWRLQALAQAARNLSEELKSRHAGLPWGEIYRFGAAAGAGFEEADLHRIWAIARHDLEPLKRIIETELGRLHSRPPRGAQDRIR